MSSTNLQRSLVGVRSGDSIVGAGVLVRHGLAITCAHVVQNALERTTPAATIGKAIKLCLVTSPGREITATVVFAGNHPALNHDHHPDLAILQLTERLTHDEASTIGRMSTGPTDSNVQFFGFPEDSPVGAARGLFRPATVTIPGGGDRCLYERGTNRFASPGCSGGLVVTDPSQEPLGIVHAKSDDKNAATEAYAIDGGAIEDALEDYLSSQARQRWLNERTAEDDTAATRDLLNQLNAICDSLLAERSRQSDLWHTIDDFCAALCTARGHIEFASEPSAELEPDDFLDLAQTLETLRERGDILVDLGLVSDDASGDIANLEKALDQLVPDGIAGVEGELDLDPFSGNPSDIECADRIRKQTEQQAFELEQRHDTQARHFWGLAKELKTGTGRRVAFRQLDRRRQKLRGRGTGTAGKLPFELQAWMARHARRLPPGVSFRDRPEAWCPEMLVIPAGRFLMGSPEDEPERLASEGPRHRVTIANPFAIGRYTITFDELDHWCEATGRDRVDANFGRGRQPAINVSWEDAQAYLAWLNGQLELPTGTYRLPSETEWEYACRAGTQTPFWTGDQLTTDQANYDGDYPYAGGVKGHDRERTELVGTIGKANRWGLWDVHGNVWEWCEDEWHENYEDCPIDGNSWLDGDGDKVLRGGAWNGLARHCRSAYRNRIAPDFRDFDVGFRATRTLC